MRRLARTRARGSGGLACVRGSASAGLIGGGVIAHPGRMPPAGVARETAGAETVPAGDQRGFASQAFQVSSALPAVTASP